MTSITPGSQLPDLEVRLTGNLNLRLSDLLGRPLILFFYPRANTPGCTQEGQDFREAHDSFVERGARVLGASRDSLKAQENFKSKYAFPFDLIADTDETLCTLFDVIKPKNMYGKQVRGIERSTFLFDAEGGLRREWRKVKIPGHVAEVLTALDDLSRGEKIEN